MSASQRAVEALVGEMPPSTFIQLMLQIRALRSTQLTDPSNALQAQARVDFLDVPPRGYQVWLEKQQLALVLQQMTHGPLVK